MNTSNNNLKEYIQRRLRELWAWILENLKIVLPIVLVICVAITLLAVSGANRKKKALEQAEAIALTEESDDVNVTATIEVPAVVLEENAYPEVNALVEKYYKAMADGDLDTVLSMNNYVDETEKIRIEETSKYIEEYKDLDIYTKKGPVDDSYLVYVYSELKFKDYETPVPGMQAYYVCKDETGNLYFNDKEDSKTVTDYIREVSLQDDVVDLNNKVAVAYNDMLADDAELSTFLVDLTMAIDTSVGETLAANEGSTVEETPEAEEEQTEEEQESVATVVKKVKATDVVNIRKSDSETADKIDKAQVGQEFVLLEEKGNGWSKIEFNDGEAYIKSEFLEPSETEIKVNDDSAQADNQDMAETTTNNTQKTETKEDTSSTTVTGTVTAKDSVRVRASASENGDKLGTIYKGEKLELIMKQADGWTKVKYKGQIAYVKSEYVE